MIVALILASLAVLFVALFVLNRWFGSITAGRTAQLAFKRRHGARVRELLGRGVDQDPRRGSPWIRIAWGDGEAGMVSARLREGRMQAAVSLDDVRLPVAIWHARTDGESDFDAADDIDRDQAAVLVARLAQLDVDNVAARAVDDDLPPLLRVQYDDVEELPERFARIRELLDALVELRVGHD